MKKIFFLILFVFVTNILFAQNLYLKVVRTKPREDSSLEWTINPNTQKLRKGYSFFLYCYNGHFLSFYCKDKSLYCQTVPASTISNYPIQTLEQLEAYFATLTPQQVVSYIDNLQNIYIVEVLPNGMMEVVKVELAIYEL